ncbi:TIGR02234 family membrane protein [Sphaerisporangium fuscum]|uniref:TIGR02234 family membrane protein n=1 Tax=Sphaerisporangium fuscum TaxID=2835868 RepID=UPI001BDBBCE6|nr:TIGR02234 family membrane protein [Sphaerisporangium fuscum]
MTLTAEAGPTRSGARRVLLAWVAAGAAGAVLPLVAAGRTWARVTFSADPGAPHMAPVTQAGGDLVPVLSPLALASLAAVVAVLATRGVWRRVIGALMALFGAAIGFAAWQGASSSHVVRAALEHSTLTGAGHATASVTWAWPATAVAGGVVLLAAGLTAVARGARWPGMSERYDRPGASGTGRGGPGGERPGAGDRSLWDALDRGVDPTDDQRG